MAQWLVDGHDRRDINRVSTLDLGRSVEESKPTDVNFWKEHFFDIFDKALNRAGFKLTYLNYDVSDHFLEFNYVEIYPPYSIDSISSKFIIEVKQLISNYIGKGLVPEECNDIEQGLKEIINKYNLKKYSITYEPKFSIQIPELNLNLHLSQEVLK